MNSEKRETLGDYSSIVCLKAIITGMEDALGDKTTAIALIAAGRLRGKQIADQLKLTEAGEDLDHITQLVATALGKDGTRLLILDKIEQTDTSYRAYTKETVCSAGEPKGSERICTFSLGAVQGVLEAVTGKRYRGQQIESVLRGGSHDVFEYTPIN